MVVITNGNQRVDHGDFFHAVRRAMRTTGVGSLLAARPSGVRCSVIPTGTSNSERDYGALTPGIAVYVPSCQVTS
jgi:hypothetical protein